MGAFSGPGANQTLCQLTARDFVYCSPYLNLKQLFVICINEYPKLISWQLV
jgi:hypothetical protein